MRAAVSRATFEEDST